MNHRSAESLFHEYLRSENAQIRRNALTAVAAAQVKSCYKDLVRLAISDPDQGVRERAEDEIASSGDPVSQEYASALQRAMASGKPALDAFLLAGRIRARGTTVPLNTPLRKKFRLAIAERFSKTGKVKRLGLWTFFLGLAAIPAVLFYLTYAVNGGGNSSSEVSAFVFLGGLIPGMLVLLTARWWRPVQMEADRLAAMIAEFSVLGLGGAAAAGMSIVFAKEPPTSGAITLTAVIVSLLSGSLSFCAVRAGTIAAYGCTGSTRTNSILQVLAGTAAGALVLTAVAAGVGNASDALTSGVWLMLLPALPGLAIAFARVDSTAGSRFRIRSVLGRWTWPATLGLILIFSVTAVIPLVPVRIQPLQPHVDPGKQTVPISLLPYSETLPFDVSQSLRIDVRDGPSGRGGLSVSLKESDGKVLGASGPGAAPTVDQLVGPGNYSILVTRQKSDSKKSLPNPDKILSLLTTRIAKGFRPLLRMSRPVVSAPLECTLQVLMSPDSHDSPNTKSPKSRIPR